MTPQPFEVGQKVKCVRGTGNPDSPLIVGKIYTIKRVYQSVVMSDTWVVDVDLISFSGYYAFRFEALSTDNAAAMTGAPINDYVCKACRNEKCSRTEKSCWRCGEPIKI